MYTYTIGNTHTWIGNAHIICIQTSYTILVTVHEKFMATTGGAFSIACKISYKLVLVDYSWCNYLLHKDYLTKTMYKD